MHIPVNLTLRIFWWGDMNVQLETMLLSTQMRVKAIIQIMQKFGTLRLVTALCPTMPDTTVPQYLILCWCTDWRLGYTRCAAQTIQSRRVVTCVHISRSRSEVFVFMLTRIKSWRMLKISAITLWELFPVSSSVSCSKIAARSCIRYLYNNC